MKSSFSSSVKHFYSAVKTKVHLYWFGSMATTASTEPYPLSILCKIKQYSQVVLKVQYFQKATMHISTERILHFLLIDAVLELHSQNHRQSPSEDANLE